MWKILTSEIINFKNSLRESDFKTVIIFMSAPVIFIFSWYYSNPRFLQENFTLHLKLDEIYSDLISYIYWFFLDSILYLIIPLAIIIVIFKEGVKDFGIIIGDSRTGLIILLFSYLIFLPLIYFLSISNNFSSYFPLMETSKDNIIVFIIYELFFLVFIFSWEFVFRGFMLFGLESKFGFYSIFIQMIPFAILHNGKPFIETFTAVFGGIFLGYLALRTRSIFYGFLLHALILVTFDFIAFYKG
jgi:membrane protease YdiL (CAAX protease family)